MSFTQRLNGAASQLRRTPWRHLVGYAYLALFLMLLVRWMAPSDMGPMLRQLGLALPLLLLASKDLAHAPDALRRYRVALDWRGRITAFLPPELLGMLRLDRLMWRGFFEWLRQRGATARPGAARLEGSELGYLQRGAYGTAIGIVMVSLFLELPVNVLIVNVMLEDDGTRMLVHLVAGVLALYSFAWVLGDRWHVGQGAHVLTHDTLHLRVGVRSQASIPLAAIERIERLEEALDRWRRRNKLHCADTLLVTPIDKPNCVLVLKPEADVTVLHWQVERKAPRYVLLYLDRPELLIRQVCRN